MAKKYVFNFNEGGIADVKLLGVKGANLAQINQLGLPIPFGFTISTAGCKYFLNNKNILPTDLIEQILRGLKAIEKNSGKLLGDAGNPLLLSVRTGSSVACKGLAKTVINVGINDEIASKLSKSVKNLNFAWECYGRFIKDFGTIVKGIDEAEFIEAEKELRASLSGSPEPEILQKIVSQYKKIYRREVKSPFPQDVAEQLFETIMAVLGSWNSAIAQDFRRGNNISDDLGCAVSVQAMAFGNLDMASGVGVAHTRNPVNGERVVTGEMLRNAQEKSGLIKHYTYDMEEFHTENPVLFMELDNACKKIENFYQDNKSIEFCIESGKLFIMQIEDAPLSPIASVRIAVDLVSERIISKEEAIKKVDAEGVKALMQKTLDHSRVKSSRLLAEGVCAFPGCASGVIAFSGISAMQFASAGEKVILIQDSLNPLDADGIAVASGIIVLKDGFNSYASVIARNKAIPCIIGAKRVIINEANHSVKLGGLNYKEGDKITIDAENGKIYGEELPLALPMLNGELGTVVGWAKKLQKVEVYADADTPQKVQRAYELGAKGIGLVRTEFLFCQEDRQKALRKFFLAPNQKVKDAALREILKYQTADIARLFEQNGSKEITVRLIDATLNEILPSTQNELRILAREMGVDYTEVKEIYNELRQSNPILGIRGCRMLIMQPELVDVQVKAIFNAVFETKKKFGVVPQLRILVPMVSVLPEYEILSRKIRSIFDEIFFNNKVVFKYEVGCMLETPRACLIADKIAQFADFVCFGTNDLTQLTFGFSSDDCMKFLQDYYDDNLIYSDPFVTMDKNGVYELIELAVNKIRGVKSNLPIWLLGDMDCDVNSLKLAMDLGIKKISCVPNKIPSAILAQVQAILENKE